MRTVIFRILATSCAFGIVLTTHAQTGQSPLPNHSRPIP